MIAGSNSAPSGGTTLVQSAASLPDLFVRASCDSERVFSGAVLLGELPRLAAWVPADAPGTLLTFKLRFFRDAGRDLLAEIAVRTSVQMDCARCLKPMILPLVGSSVLHFVYNDEQAQQVIEAREPVLIDVEGSVSIASLLEEEVLMALPPVAMHEHQCRPAWQEVVDDGIKSAEPSAAAQPNPFAALAQQWHQPAGAVRNPLNGKSGKGEKSDKTDDQ
ncbi:MAG: hypothetical protein B7Z82_07100 [Halothiobacillus sp. 20-54-6]|nr:MAG: hypothetical protein B7Z82_07100 [Halothiobacillus sp. 20-54-6]